VFMTEGEGGPQSYTSAAEWYRKAAEYGVVDSQFNLALFYQDGLGISPSLTEALFWFEVAALQGDNDARQSTITLRDRVSTVAADQILERARNWSPTTRPAEANGEFANLPWGNGPSRKQIAAIQTRLSALGYDTGGSDGAFGPRTRTAIKQFETATGLAPTGTVTNRLIEKLNNISTLDRG
ncbi:MAG: SEL1-like repeat protein, partial [Pseudomonadota bacterium]